MPDETNSLYAFTIESARHPVYDNIDPSLLEPLGLIVQKNTGVQIVYSSIEYSLARAKRFKPPFREYAIEMVMSDKKGMRSISSEGGAYIREFGTTRSSIPIGSIVGPAVSESDVYLHEQILGEKGKFRGNPKKKGWGIDL